MPRYERKAAPDFLLVARMDVRRIADVDRHREPGVRDLARSPPLRLPELRPTGLDRLLLRGVEIRERDDEEWEIAELKAPAPISDQRRQQPPILQPERPV